MSQGCKYFPSQNVPGETIDEQCVSYHNRCLTNKKQTVKIAPIEVVQPNEVEIVHESLEFISGPISWYYFETGPELFGIRRKFHFFGDVHFSKTSDCTEKYAVPCAEVSPLGKVSNLNERCYDITYLLMDLFQRAKKENRYTDFFLEYPFKIKPNGQDSSNSNSDQLVDKMRSFELTKEQTLLKLIGQKSSTAQNLDYISTLYVMFHDCFQISKKQCPYGPYVRFHYVDVRLSEKQQIIALNSYIFMEKLPDILQAMSLYYQLSMYTMFADIPEISVLRQKIIDSVEFTNHLTEKIYIPEHTLDVNDINYNLELFNLALESDDYVNDVNRLIDVLVEGIKIGTEDQKDFEQFRQDMVQPVVHRAGKVQHRTRVQLEELAQENIQVNGKNLADLIVEFITKLYKQLNFIQVYSSLRNFYTVVYPAFLAVHNEDTIRKAQYELQRYLSSRQTGGQLIHADALLLDGYMLARMFRTFPNPRYERAVHNSSDRVITYTGAHHTDNYARFFQEMLGLNPIDSRVNRIDLSRQHFQNINRCLQNSNFEKYFA